MELERALLAEAGLDGYTSQALISLMTLGVADAAALCRDGRIPTSKIYRAMEKLVALGLAQQQRGRPRLFQAEGADVIAERLVAAQRARLEDFSRRAERLREALLALPGRARGRRTQVDVALGTESQVKRHLAQLSSARDRTLSYLEAGDLVAIESARAAGFDVLKRIAATPAARGVERRVVFGFSDRGAPRLLAFLRQHASALGRFSGLRYSGEIGHPFHVIDGATVILSLDHPFVPEGRFASLLVHDEALAERLATGFEGLWQKALADLRELRFYPRRP